MEEYRITYLPFATSDLEASDVVVYAKDQDGAQQVFERIYPGFVFKKAAQTR